MYDWSLPLPREICVLAVESLASSESGMDSGFADDASVRPPRRPGADRGPTGPRPIIIQPRPLRVVGVLQLLDVDQSGHKGCAVLALAVVEQLVDKALAVAMHGEVLEVDQAREMDLELRVAPAERLAQATAAEAVSPCARSPGHKLLG